MATVDNQRTALLVGGTVMVVAIAGAVVLTALGRDSAALMAAIVPTAGVLFTMNQNQKLAGQLEQVKAQTNGVLTQLVARVPEPLTTRAASEGHVDLVEAGIVPGRDDPGRHSVE